MNRILKILLSIVLFITLTINVSANNNTTTDTNYQKTISIGIEPLTTLFMGPTVFVEYSDLGGFSLFGGYQYISSTSAGVDYIEDEYDIKVDGYGLNTGFRYYFNYKYNGLDSFYAGAGLAYNKLNAEESAMSNNTLIFNTKSIFFTSGKRWQWHTLFVDLNGYLMYSIVDSNRNNNFNKKTADDFKEGIEGFVPGLQVIVGISF